MLTTALLLSLVALADARPTLEQVEREAADARPHGRDQTDAGDSRRASALNRSLDERTVKSQEAEARRLLATLRQPLHRQAEKSLEESWAAETQRLERLGAGRLTLRYLGAERVARAVSRATEAAAAKSPAAKRRDATESRGGHGR